MDQEILNSKQYCVKKNLDPKLFESKEFGSEKFKLKKHQPTQTVVISK